MLVGQHRQIKVGFQLHQEVAEAIMGQLIIVILPIHLQVAHVVLRLQFQEVECQIAL